MLNNTDYDLDTIWPFTISYFEYYLRNEIASYKEKVIELATTYKNNIFITENKDFFLESLHQIEYSVKAIHNKYLNFIKEETNEKVDKTEKDFNKYLDVIFIMINFIIYNITL